MTKSQCLNIRYHHDKFIEFVAEVIHDAIGIYHLVYDLGIGDG